MGHPETYLKTTQVATALGVSVSTIKRWVDAGTLEATKTAGKHRLVPLSAALRFARQGKYPVQPLLAIFEPDSPCVVDEDLVERFVDALKLGRTDFVREVVRQIGKTPHGSVVLADEIIRPAMERIGNGWMHGSWDIYQEHEATLILVSLVLNQIGRFSGGTTPNRPLAIGATPAGDPYQLPGLLAELVLREVGWEVKNLGNNLPLRSLAKATREHRPGIIFLSASQIEDRETFIHDYAYLYEAANQVSAAIILGGRGFDHELRSKLVYASFGERMAHLAEFARRLLPTAENQIGSAAIPQASMNSQV